MLRRLKLIDSSFDSKTGISTATIRTKRETYTATAKTHPTDKEIESRFFGMRTAEKKAARKAYKDELKREKIILSALRSFKKDLMKVLPDDGSYGAYITIFYVKRRFYFAIKNHENNIEYLKNLIQSINDTLEEDKKYLQKIKEKKGQRNKN